MATDKTYPSGLRRIGGGTAESTHTEHGIATPDSIEAAIQQGIGVVVEGMPTLTAAQAALADAQQALADVGPAAAAAAEPAITAAQQAAADVQTALQAQFMTQDEGVAALIETAAGPNTRAALDAITVTGPSASGGDDTAALQAFINTNAGKAAKLPPLQSYEIAGTITVPAGGIRLDMQGSTVTKTGTGYAPIFDATGKSGVAVSGGTFVGLDNYTESTSVYAACVIRAGAGSSKVRLIDCNVSKFAGPAVYATDAAGVTVRGNTIVGPGQGGGGSAAFTAGVSKDSAGVILDGHTTAAWVIDNDISYVAQGVLGGNGSDGIQVRGNRIHDVGGQHGVYLNAGTSFDVSHNTICRTAAAGVKVQTNSGGGAPDLLGAVIASNIVHDVGGSGIHVVSALPPAVDKRIRALSVTGNSVRNAAGDGIYLMTVVGASVTGNVVGGASAGLHITDSTGVTVAANQVWSTQRQGILVESVALPTTGIRTLGNTIRDFALGGGTIADFGIQVLGAGCSDLTFDGDRIVGSGSAGRYLVYVASGDQATMTFRNLVGSGATASGFRGVAATKVREWTNCTLDGATNRFHQAPADHSLGYPGRTTYGATAPTSGTWVGGDICYRWPPVVGQPKAWVCTAGGVPGTWISQGNL